MARYLTDDEWIVIVGVSVPVAAGNYLIKDADGNVGFLDPETFNKNYQLVP